MNNIQKIVALVMMMFLIGCGAKHSTNDAKPLFEVLTQQEDGGASIRFFEILTEEREIKMLQNDELLQNKISTEDLKTANFVILNMGEKTALGYKIAVKSVEETPNQIIIKVEDAEPKLAKVAENDVYYYPYSIVKINSKKEIVVQ